MLQSLLQRISLLQPRGCNQPSSPNPSSQGLTIIECLVAMVIASIVLAFISPPILLAVATRVQNQKAEQSFELAQSEVDRIRVLLERGGTYTNDDLPKFGADDISTDPPFDPPASGAAGYTTVRADMAANKGLAVDVNQDGTYDFVVQTFRDKGFPSGSTETKIAFEMGVRVYTYKALENGATLETKAAPLGFTSAEGFQNTRPLSVIFTQLTRSDLKESLNSYPTPSPSPTTTP